MTWAILRWLVRDPLFELPKEQGNVRFFARATSAALSLCIMVQFPRICSGAWADSTPHLQWHSQQGSLADAASRLKLEILQPHRCHAEVHRRKRSKAKPVSEEEFKRCLKELMKKQEKTPKKKRPKKVPPQIFAGGAFLKPRTKAPTTRALSLLLPAVLRPWFASGPRETSNKKGGKKEQLYKVSAEKHAQILGPGFWPNSSPKPCVFGCQMALPFHRAPQQNREPIELSFTKRENVTV